MPKKLVLRGIAPESLGDATPVPVFVHKFAPEEGRRIFIFALRGEDRDALSSVESVRNLAQVLGDLAHPASSVLAVIPKNMVLEVLEVVEEETTNGESEGSN